jgi:hypothetical protein
MVVIQTGYHGLHAVDIVALGCKHILGVVVILNLLMVVPDVADPAKKLKIVNITSLAQVGLLYNFVQIMNPSWHASVIQNHSTQCSNEASMLHPPCWMLLTPFEQAFISK